MIRQHNTSNQVRHFCRQVFILLALLMTSISVWGQTDITSLSDITDPTGYYRLTSDVSGSGHTSITTFSGTLEAAIDPTTKMPYRITDLDAPLFTTLTGTVKNLVLEDVNISGNTGNTGAIACTANGAARIYNIGILSGEVGGSAYTGGLVGLLDGTARVINCYSFADITSGTNVGGIVGYNNVTTNSDAANLKTMVMNCMFYGDLTGGTTKSPIYGGKIISNADNKGVGNYNYFRLEAPFVQPTGITYNCALGAEDRFLKRFEFYRLLLNSHRELAGWWATGTFSSSEMLKWVLETADRTIDNPKPYPVLKVQGRYPSIANYDAEHAPTLALVNGKPREEDRNKGGKFGTLTVNIQMGDGAVYKHPTGATITTSQLTLNITDKDPDRFNFNYYKVQLPYYNDVGTKNYNGNRVVTGWKIVNITGGTPGTFTASDTWGGYNFADRNCTNKDLYGTGGSNRIFNQGAYWDVPEGVTAITIEPYWAKCVYLADPNADKVYNTAMETGYDVANVGGGVIYTNGNSYSIAGESQVVYTSMGNAIASSGTALFSGVDANSHSVYDYAVVLVGNYHHFNSIEASKAKPYTVTSIDLDGDNEPDYSYILRFNGRTECHPVRADFINIPGFGMAQKSNGGTGSYNFGILIPKGWFESTNTSLFRVTQFEYENSARSETDALIVQGGVMEQWVSYNQKGRSNKIPYIHVGGNVWFKEFHTGCHQDKNQTSGGNRFQPTKHSPISVTGGDFDEFYLTGLYVANAGLDNYADNAECYINGGRFGTVCGAAMEGIGKANGADNTGNISWLIQNADIREFYAGGLNAAKPVTGNLSTTIVDSHVDIFCGGPKFGDMSANKTVTTNATGCTFGTFFGAGYGGNSYSRYAPTNQNSVTNIDWNNWVRGQYKRSYNATYGGVSTRFVYQFLPMSDNKTNVARILVDFVKFSLATTRNVTSTLTGCTITNNFYGGGSLGKVDGSVTSTLNGCTVNGSAFGAGFSASLPTVEVDSIGFRVEPYYYDGLGTYRTGVKGVTTTYRWEHGNSISVDNTKHILYTTEDLTTLGTVTGKATLNITGNTIVEGKVFNEDGTVKEITGGVFGGGDASAALGDTEVNVNGGKSSSILNVFGGGNRADVSGNVTVNMRNGTVNQSVYGGGALANTNIGNVTDYGKPSETISSTSTKTTTVNLLGGTINGDAYGGGLGRIGVTATAGEKYTQEEIDAAQEGDPAYGKTTDDWKVPPVVGVEEVKALVYGDVNVNLGSSASGSSATAFNTGYYTGDHADVVKSGRLFGCNNLNGSPKGEVTVTVYKTVPGNNTRTASGKLLLEEGDDEYVPHTYELTAVYGGGNLADFTTPVTGKKANVIIETCDVSIRDVYGGGNAAAVPETNVLVRGSYEILEVFGGGNGKDPYTLDGGTTWVDNQGANVNGNANTLLTGGYIHEAYGGSNDKGNITGTVTIDVGMGDDDHCELNVIKIVGAGKNADIEGDLIMVLGCKPDVEVKQLFCGADNANVYGNVETTITSGKFAQVFGGNNEGGAILGHIKLNIEETGDCEVPIKIGELYLGGNQAAYSIYGYYDSGETLLNGKPKYLPRTSTADTHTAIASPATDATHSFPYAQPELNIISCTYIGKVFGGGLGTGAAMYANPTVNINMVPGSFANNTSVGVPATMTELGLDSSDNPNNLGVLGDVYGGGNEAAVYGNTKVNIGTLVGQPITLTSTGDTPNVVGAFISGTVYGAGRGLATDPNAAIVTGNTQVNMAGGHVSRSIYGGGELSSVGTFDTLYTVTLGDTIDADYHVIGEPKTCVANTGLTEVIVSGGQVGLVNQLMPDPSRPTSDDDYGYIFCAGKGMADPTNKNSDGVSYANLLAICGSSHLVISDDALVAASVYGGSENGQVLGDTYVEIKGGQIGTGHYKEGDTHHWDPAYTDAQWTAAINAIKSGVVGDINTAVAPFHECDSWPFGTEGNRHVYDYFHGTAGYDSKGGGKPGSDGHSYYGHVFGGGSGYYPFAAGKWRRTAGRVNGNTVVEISGGHVLTNVYGGNEITDVLGSSKVEMWGGTVGVPRTIPGIQARPVNSYIFGAGMGDPRALFNGWSNVGSAEVIVRGDAVVFGSVFGGGEDGHVLGDVSTTIKGDALIGTFGSSGVDGNIFGSGRGFSALTLTAGAVCGNVTVNIAERAKILGSIFGGGRMAAVGTYLALETDANYGKLIAEGQDPYGTGSTTHGNVTIKITGGTIGNLSQMDSPNSIGDVFGGSKGVLMSEWAKSQKLGLVKNTTVNISQAAGYTTTIYGNVYGGGELASGGSYNYATTAEAYTYNTNHPSEPMTEGDVLSVLESGTGLATILITGGTIGQNDVTDTHGHVFGGCLGRAGTAFSGYSFVNNSDVTLDGGTVYGCVFGGGENGHVLADTDVKIKSGTVGIALDKSNIADANLSDNMIYRGNVYGGGRGIDKTTGGNYSITAGKVSGNTNVTIEGGTVYRAVYGGGSLASVGKPDEQPKTALQPNGTYFATGLATVTIKGGRIGSDGGASANTFTGGTPGREHRRENGFVFGSGRGMAAGVLDHAQFSYLAYVKNTVVNIEDGATVTGSVFGGGENGHVRHDTKVYVNGGSVGTELTAIEQEIDHSGRSRHIYRGNVYGGGRGVDRNDEDKLSKTAGRVYGNAYVEINDGHIYHDVFGGGELGSVGTITNSTKTEGTAGTLGGQPMMFGFLLSMPYTFEYDKDASGKATTGLCTVKVNGGKVGGDVFGASRGQAGEIYEMAEIANIINSDVYIGADGSSSTTSPDIYGSVYGGGENGHILEDAHVTINGGLIGQSVFGSGQGTDKYAKKLKRWEDDSEYDGEAYSLTAGKVYGNTYVDMKGGLVTVNVYGGGKLASVGKGNYSGGLDDYFPMGYGETINGNLWDGKSAESKLFLNTGKATVKVTGGTVGSVNGIDATGRMTTGNVFGGSQGEAAPNIFNQPADDYNPVFHLANINEADVTIGTEGSATGPRIYGSVYGGGQDGHMRRDAKVTVFSGEIGNAYNDANKTAVGTSDLNNLQWEQRGNVFGAGSGFGLYSFDYNHNGKTYTDTNGNGRYDDGEPIDTYEYGGTTYYDMGVSYLAGCVARYSEVNIKGGIIHRNVYGGGSVAGTGEPKFGYQTYEPYKKGDPDHGQGTQSQSTVTVSGGTIGESGYGGNVFGASRGNETLLEVDERLTTTIWAKVNILGGTIWSDVYGGGELGTVKQDTEVNLVGGTINGSVYGGGKGTSEVAADIGSTLPSPPNLGGNTSVYLNGSTETGATNDCKVRGNIFGCNNINGTPKGHALVHIYKTVGYDDSHKKSAAKDNTTYDVAAVYGGGNMAAYVPASNSDYAEVIIDGCDLTSIAYVYGGGNAASAPATRVTVNGTYEIGTIFGGGNGKDALPNGDPNPGAHVGLMTYPNTAGDAYSTKAERAANYGYGTGKAHVIVYGGTVHEVYGGSNTKGNVRVEARATLEDQEDCDFNLGEAYGGGRNAEMDGDAVLEVGCIKGLDRAYGGAANADVNGDVVLNITNGTYGQVFGGNDMGGNISGSITVNIEETGCRPIIIGELYGGGNEAAYTAPTGGNYPVLNIKSFTSIGTVFGGGYGEAAVITGNPEVNINVVTGKYRNTVVADGAMVVGSSVKNPGDSGYDASTGFSIPAHQAGTIGNIGTVFGGGNAAKVIGNTNVNIGTRVGDEVYGVVAVATGADVTAYYTRSGDTYTAATGTAVAGTTYYEKKKVAVRIVGNVFGGGNKAEVTGDTNVIIGKE